MQKIIIKSIPHNQHRYPTLGDYVDNDYIDFNLENKKETNIFVSDMGNEDYEFMIAIHEMVEQYLCRKRGIKEKDISDFDIAFEELNIDEEPGDQYDAPYRNEHRFSENIERLICAELGIHWDDYEKFTCDFFDKNR